MRRCFVMIWFVFPLLSLPSVADESPETGKVEASKKRKDGGVPAGAAGFRGRVSGTVETVDGEHGSFKLKVTAVVPEERNKAARPEALVGAVVVVSRDYGKGEDGKPVPRTGHGEFIARLKPGEHRDFAVRYSRGANRLRLTAVPEEE